MAVKAKVSVCPLPVPIVWGSSRVKVGLYFRRFALKISTLSKVPLCGLSPEGTGRGGVRGLFLHRMRVGSKSDVKRLRKGGRRIVVWDVNSAGDAAAMRAYGVDFIVTDDPESIGGR